MVELGLIPLGVRRLRRRPGQHLAVSLPLLQGTKLHTSGWVEANSKHLLFEAPNAKLPVIAHS